MTVKILGGLVAVVLVLGAYPAEIVAAELDQLRERALALVNDSRRQRDLPPLELGAELNAAAQRHAGDMLERDYYSHTSPEGGTVMDRYVEAGGNRWRLVQENIARCASCDPPPTIEEMERLHRGWMDSPEHRENILGHGLDRFGFGVAAGDGGLYAVQTFAGPGTPRGTTDEGDKRSLPAQEQLSTAVALINEIRRAADAPPLQGSEPLSQTARTILSKMEANEGSLQGEIDLSGSLSPEQRRNWRSLSVIVGRCGGCGTSPTAADIRFFRGEWRDDPNYRRTATDPQATHLGFAMRADGAGQKTALGVFGTRR